MTDFMCPYCGAMLRTEPLQQISCGSCGAALSVPPGGGEFACQTAPPLQPVIDTQTQTCPQMQQTFYTAPVMPQPQYSPAELAAAKAKRDRWGWQGILTALIQSMLIAVAMSFERRLPEHEAEWLLVLWLISQVPAAMLLAWLRPDNAFIEKPPRPKSRFILFCLLLAALILLTGFFGVMIGAVMMIFFS